MKLVIVESKAKCKKIESWLGYGYKCVASFGHIRKFENGLKSIDIKNNFYPSYKLDPSKARYTKILKDNIKKADEIILATDDDREGEAIAWHICKEFNLNIHTTKRIIFHEITKKAILKAIQAPTIVNLNKVHSQQARSILDLIVGYKITPFLWENISRNSKNKLSAGRCQTPALRIIYDREKEIQLSKPKKVYETFGNFSPKNIEFKLNKNFKKESTVNSFLDKSIKHKHILTKKEKKIITKHPPIPFTTSLLQQKSSNSLNFSPKQTMRYAQNLYEGGFITYMRTDSKSYSPEFIKKAETYINDKWGKKYISNKLKTITNGNSDQKKDDNAQEAHESIRPTDLKGFIEEKDKIGPREIKLYKLIWNNTVESCMSSATYKTISASISSPEKPLYKNTEELVIFPGWKIVRGYEETNEKYDYLFSIKEGTIINMNLIESKVTIKDLKPHYSEAKLVQLLEKKGIGRPSTFSSLVEKIQEREFIKKQDVEGKCIKCVNFKLENDSITQIESNKIFGNEHNKLVLQPLGEIVLEFLLKHFEELFNYDYTKNMNERLDIIEKGNSIWHNLCDDVYKQIKLLSNNIKPEKKMIQIDKYHHYMIGKFGPVIKYEKEGNIEWKSVIKNIDLKKLENGEYKIEELIEKGTSMKGRNLGIHNDKEVLLKNGKFGYYINYNNKNKSIKHMTKDFNEITLEDVVDLLDNKKTTNPNIIKIINDELSIRKGKYGPYVMYKKPDMKKPKFISLKKTKVDDVTLEWIQTQI
jgi:DNA topoisomerase I